MPGPADTATRPVDDPAIAEVLAKWWGFDALRPLQADAIRAAIEDNWSRPPSARRDMEVVLRLQLIPTGEVVSVTVVKSSGNEAFDTSAINAVKKAGRFPEVADVPQPVFERHLRSFQLVFRPEDLRL